MDKNHNKRILLVTHVCPYPPGAGNEIRIFKLLSYLTSLNYEILLFVKADTLSKDTLAGLSQITDKVFYSGNFNQAMEFANPPYINYLFNTRLWEKISRISAKIARRIKTNITNSSISDCNFICDLATINGVRRLYKQYKPSVVIAEYVFMSPCLKALPDEVFKIIDTIDVFSRKLTDVNAYGVDDKINCTEEEEREHLLRANLILGIQRNETSLLKSLAPEREVITIGIDLPIVEEISEKEIIPATILVVGSDNPLNVHGITSFLEKAWPIIHQKNPNVTLTVAGRLASVIQTDIPNVVKLGWIEDLNTLYRSAEIVINPVIAGTGLKIKSVEALCHAKALVAWENGVEGIEFSGKMPFVVCNSWKDFAHTCLDLFEDKKRREELQQLALKTACENFSSDAVYAPLRQKLESLTFQSKCKN